MENNLTEMLTSLAKIKATSELDFMFNRNKVWVHNKTSNLYVVEGVAFDTTNSTEGRILVIYKPLYQDFDHPVYARDINEFLEKFKAQE